METANQGFPQSKSLHTLPLGWRGMLSPKPHYAWGKRPGAEHTLPSTFYQKLSRISQNSGYGSAAAQTRSKSLFTSTRLEGLEQHSQSLGQEMVRMWLQLPEPELVPRRQDAASSLWWWVVVGKKIRTVTHPNVNFRVIPNLFQVRMRYILFVGNLLNFITILSLSLLALALLTPGFHLNGGVLALWSCAS